MIGASLRLVRLVGRGAMGTVWVADHLGLHSQVAVKFMAQAMLDDQVSLLRFQQEAKAAAEIRSPHVVRVFDHGTTDDGVPYIVMEFLDGESLDRKLKRLGTLSLAEVATIVRQSCKALAKAHERGIVHRDIKPGNVFLSSDDDLFVKVVDFGVAKFSGQEAIEMTAQGNMIGTPAYMSPEQLFHGKGVDHRGDLWSLAVVAYQALTGERPFDGVTLGELCVSIKRGEFTPVTTARAHLPSALDGWFARAFAGNPDARFETAKEMALAFDEAVGTNPFTTSTPSLTGQPPRVSASYPSLPGAPAPSLPTAHGGGSMASGAGSADAPPQISTFSGGTSTEASPSQGRSRQRWMVAVALFGVGFVLAALIAMVTGGPSRSDLAATSATPPATLGSVRAESPTCSGTRVLRDGECVLPETLASAAPPSSSVSASPIEGGTAQSASAAASGEAAIPPRTWTPMGRPPVGIRTAAPPPVAPQAGTGTGDADERSRRAAEQLGL